MGVYYMSETVNVREKSRRVPYHEPLPPKWEVGNQGFGCESREDESVSSGIVCRKE